jgi:hypothetical protein
VPVDVSEYLGGLSSLGQTVQGTRRGVHVRRSGRPGGCYGDVRMEFRWRKKDNELKKAALTIEGKALIPDWRIEMNQAELAAVPVPVMRSGLSDGQIRPRMNTPVLEVR